MEEEGGEKGSTFWWWFSMNRVDGGPAYHPPHGLACPSSLWSLNVTISTLVFIFVACLVLLPTIRNRRWSSFMVVLLCFGTGLLLTVVYGSSSWLVGEAEVNVSVGPQKPPVPGTLGVWAGLWHVNLTYVTAAFSLNERVDWTSRKDFVAAHKKALSDGWPWALVSLTAELGGEGTAWRGLLGDGLRVAGLATSSLLVAAMTVWAVWVLLFTVSPQVAAPPIIFSGAILALCSVVYVVSVSLLVPHTLVVAGAKLELHLGHAWWLTSALGLSLTLVGLGMLLYDIFRPGKLASVFELDFGSPNHPLYQSPWRCSKSILAFSEGEEETYSQGYPWPRPPRHLKAASCSPLNKAAKRKKAKNSPRRASEQKPRERAITDPGSIQRPESFKKERLHETQKTPEGQDNVVCEEAAVATLSVSTLGHDQDHTTLSTFNIQPVTLRRRSPEQPQEHQPPSSAPRKNFTPPTVFGSDTGSTTGLLDSHSTLVVEKYVPKTNALLRNPFRRSTKSLSRFQRRTFPIRLSYKSPLRWKTLSLSRLAPPSEAGQELDKEAGGRGQECDVAAARRESTTRL